MRKPIVHICSLMLVMLAGMLPIYSQSFDWYNIATDSPRPSARSGHGMVYDPAHARVVLFGGADSTGTRNDVWEFDTATRHWTNVTPSSGAAPVPRSSFGMALDENRGVIVIYGGSCGANCVEYGNVAIVGDTWEWNTTTRTWRKAPNTIPGIFVGLTGTALAYDLTRHQVIAFAGRPYWCSYCENRTWAWDGTSWTEITPATSPDGRFDHAMTTDTDRNRIVMFGPFEDTWEWDGSRWIQVGLTGPHPTWRFGVKMAYDKIRHKTVLFGGSNQYTAFNETWEWDGTTWTQLSPLHSPPGRGYTSLVYDESQNVLMMFSGGGQPDDFWFSGPSDNIPPVSEATSSPSANLVGWTNQEVTLTLNTTDNTGGAGVKEITYSASGAQNVASTTVSGASANLTITAEGTTTVTFFARDNAGNTETAHTLVLKIDKTAPSLTVPSGISVDAPDSSGTAVSYQAGASDALDPSPALSCSPASGSTFPIGATQVICTATDKADNSASSSFTVWVTRDLGFDWYNIATDSPRPSPRTGHGMVYDPIHEKVILFGGSNGSTLFNDIWEFDTASRHWTNVTPLTGPAPAPRYDFGIAYDENRGVVVLYGGYCGSQCTGGPVIAGTIGDTWEWNTSTRTWRLAPGAAPTFDGPQGAALAYDPTRHQVIRFGGRAYYNRGVNSTWAFNGIVWTNVTPAVSPQAIFDHTMTLDSDRNRIVMFGGSNEESWEWDGSKWIQVALTGAHPPWRFGPTMAYDKSRHRTVLFGGSNQFIAYDETWNWNGSRWTQLSPLHRPPGRGYTAMVFDESQNVLVVFGGNGITDDTWISGPADGITPVTEASASPFSNSAGWNNQNVVVTLNATDNLGGSGVQQITYSASGAQTIGSTILNGATANLTITAEGITTVTYFARDNAGNTETPQTITIRIDKTPPVISDLPSNQIIEATGANGAAVSWNSPTATDALDPNVSVVCSPPSDSIFAIGTTVVQCTAADRAGNSSTGSFNVTVADNTAPTLTNIPANFNIEATGPSGATVSYTTPTATDTVDGNVAVNCNPASGSIFALGTTQVICTATDAHNNSSSKHFTVTVRDTTAPTLSVPANQTLNTATANASFTWTATATDIVSGNLAVNCSPASPAVFSLGTTQVNCSATDAAGNSASRSFKVTVLDNGAPGISIASPINNGNYTLGQSVTADYSCSDAGSGIQSCVGTAANGAAIDTATIGTKSLTVTARDNAGNQTSQTVTYTVGYGIVALFDQTKAHNSGSNIPIKLKIVDSSGVNRSNQSIVLTALRVDPGNLTAQSPGNSNPTNAFTFDSSSQSYQYNLKSNAAWSAGTYRLVFLIAGDPVEHSVSFIIR